MKQEHNQERDSMEKATERPWTWFIGNSNGKGLIRIESSCDAKPSGEHVTSLTRGLISEANAALIVRAVNSHEALIEALEKAYDRLLTCEGDKTPDGESRENIEELELIESALKLAKGA